MDPVGILLQTPLFNGLDPADVSELAPRLAERRFARGEPVWLEGDRADALYVIAVGQLKSHRLSRDGVEVILRLHPAIDVTGEVGLFHPGHARLVSVTAMEATTCFVLGREPLLAFLSGHPMVMQRMLERLALTAGQAAYAFSGLAFDDIRRRVAVALLALADEFGLPTQDGGVRIRLRFSQSTLAALVAASRENVNRAIQALVASGAVQRSEGYFEVCDRSALDRFANL